MEAYTYQTIDLSYLKEISMGDEGYALEMAGKFIQIISDELVELRGCLEREDIVMLKRVAHKMRSTVYLMGLKPKLIEVIDAIEYKDLALKELKVCVATVITVCEKAKEETKLFLDGVK